jgi:hypothetical protein
LSGPTRAPARSFGSCRPAQKEKEEKGEEEEEEEEKGVKERQ